MRFQLATAYRIVVKNTRAEKIQLTLVDQVPISRDDEVKVEDVVLSPAPQEKTDSTGERRWNLELSPRTEASVGIGFTIRFPEKRASELVGLAQ